jgi:hypothetical protein
LWYQNSFLLRAVRPLPRIRNMQERSDESIATNAVKTAFHCECSRPIGASVKTDILPR